MKFQTLYEYNQRIFTLTADENSLLELRLHKNFNNESLKKQNIILKNTVTQLDEYFQGKRKSFELPIKLNGTEFQQKVWQNLQKIPYGKTISYKQLADMCGNPKASRAVGMANNKNPIAIIVPCHRVIGTNGKLTGYAGGLDLKSELLKLEKINENN